MHCPVSSHCVNFYNGIKCPILGFGTWLARKNECYQAVRHALEIGYRYIDTAFFYENEQEVGKAINEKIAEGLVRREDVFIVSKLSSANHEQNMVVPALKKSLEYLNLQYLDLFLIHTPMATKPLISGVVNLKSQLNDSGEEVFIDVNPQLTWLGMEECVNLGLVKSIGLSNFNSKQIQDILNVCRIKPVLNQIECHPHLNQERFLNFLNEHDIILGGYRPLGGSKHFQQILHDKKIAEIAKKYKKTPAQILIRWNIQRGVVVIPKSCKPDRIQENFNVFDFVISEEDMQKIMNIDDGTRLCEFAPAKVSKYYFLQDGLEF